jgi:uncharacterized protein (TIGR02300 family)
MALGTKRICGKCGAKFYDLEKSPIICPKCGTNYDEYVVKKKTKKELSENDVDLDIEIEDVDDIEPLEELEEDEQIDNLDDDIRESMEIKDDEEVIRDKASTDADLIDLEGDTDDMIDSGGDDDN